MNDDMKDKAKLRKTLQQLTDYLKTNYDALVEADALLPGLARTVCDVHTKCKAIISQKKARDLEQGEKFKFLETSPTVWTRVSSIHLIGINLNMVYAVNDKNCLGSFYPDMEVTPVS